MLTFQISETTIETRVPKDNKASNKASIPEPFKASLFTFLPTCLKYKPRTILTTTAIAIRIKETTLKSGSFLLMMLRTDSIIAPAPATRIITLIIKLVIYSTRPCP